MESNRAFVKRREAIWDYLRSNKGRVVSKTVLQKIHATVISDPRQKNPKKCSLGYFIRAMKELEHECRNKPYCIEKHRTGRTLTGYSLENR